MLVSVSASSIVAIAAAPYTEGIRCSKLEIGKAVVINNWWWDFRDFSGLISRLSKDYGVTYAILLCWAMLCFWDNQIMLSVFALNRKIFTLIKYS